MEYFHTTISLLYIYMCVFTSTESESDGCIHIVNLNNVHNYETAGPTVDQESR